MFTAANVSKKTFFPQKKWIRLFPREQWPNKSQNWSLDAWLNGVYMENRYGQRITSKHVHAGRPGTPVPVMIKRNPIFHHLRRSEQYSAFAFFISQSKSDYSLPAHNSGSCRFVCIEIMFLLLLSPAIQIAAISWAGLQSVLLWKLQSSLENGRCVSQDIMLPNYHFSRVFFARISCCQNIVMPKYQNSVFPNISLPQFVRRLMGQKVRKITIWVVPKHNILCNHWGWWFQWNRHPLRYSRWTKYSNSAARTMLNPRAPKSQCFSARVSKSDVRGLIFFVHWG